MCLRLGNFIAKMNKKFFYRKSDPALSYNSGFKRDIVFIIGSDEVPIPNSTVNPPKWNLYPITAYINRDQFKLNVISL